MPKALTRGPEHLAGKWPQVNAFGMQCINPPWLTHLGEGGLDDACPGEHVCGPRRLVKCIALDRQLVGLGRQPAAGREAANPSVCAATCGAVGQLLAYGSTGCAPTRQQQGATHLRLHISYFEITYQRLY